MRFTAPAVSVRCGAGPAWHAAQTLLMTLAAATLAAWGLAVAEQPWWPAALVAAGVALPAWHVTRSDAATLQWNGQHWSLDDEAGAVEVALDLGPWLLLRHRAPGRRSRWLAAGRAEVGAAWHALRVALYAAQPQER